MGNLPIGGENAWDCGVEGSCRDEVVELKWECDDDEGY